MCDPQQAKQILKRARKRLPDSIFADSIARTFPIHDVVHVRSLLATMTMYPKEFKNNPRFKLIFKNVLEAAEKFKVESTAFRKVYMLPEPFIFR